MVTVISDGNKNTSQHYNFYCIFDREKHKNDPQQLCWFILLLVDSGFLSVGVDRLHSVKTLHLQVTVVCIYMNSTRSIVYDNCLLLIIWFSIDYYSLKSGSRPSSPGQSPTPSVAGSSHFHLQLRQAAPGPLISPADSTSVGKSCGSFPLL